VQIDRAGSGFNALNPGCGRRKKRIRWEPSRLKFCRGLKAPSTRLQEGGTHAPHLILYIPYAPHPRIAIYTHFNAACRLSRTYRYQHVASKYSGFPLTSSSILASAISASLPLPLAIFWASAIWFLTAFRNVSDCISLSSRIVLPQS
jgi:hypothetical protein